MNITIVTITFNNYEELLKTLESTKQLNCERIVINGGSCQKTKDFLESRKDIISVSEPDEGIADAFNKGVQLASGDAIWILNSGDICIDPNFIKFAQSQLTKCDFIHSDIILNHNTKGKMILKSSNRRPLGFGMPYPHPGLIIKKSIFEEVGPFKKNYKIAMDYEFLCRMHKTTKNGVKYNNPTVLMDGRGISNTNHCLSLSEQIHSLKENNLLKGLNYLGILWISLKLFIKEKVGKL